MMAFGSGNELKIVHMFGNLSKIFHVFITLTQNNFSNELSS